MTWFKVDDSFHSHPKVMAVDPAALGLWVVAGSWCSAGLTDGFVPDYALPRLAVSATRLATKLVAAGLWTRVEGGYQFHDWLQANPTAESEKDRKAKTAKRQREFRERSNALRDASPTPSRNGGTNHVTNGAPSRPVPLGSSVRGIVPEPAARENDQERPPERCSKHRNDLDAPPCAACGAARRQAQAWDADAPKRVVDDRLTIRACPWCDADGWRLTPGSRVPASPYTRCDHTRTEVNA